MVKKWSNPLDVAAYQILANAIRIGLDKRILTKKDLFQTDKYVFNKLKKSKVKEILINIQMLNPKLKVKNNKKNYDFYSKDKLRYIDPKYLNKDNSINRVSDVFESFSKKLIKHKEHMEDGNFVKIVSY